MKRKINVEELKMYGGEPTSAIEKKNAGSQ